MTLKELLQAAEPDNTVEIRSMSDLEFIVDDPQSLLESLPESALSRNIERIHAAKNSHIMVLVK